MGESDQDKQQDKSPLKHPPFPKSVGSNSQNVISVGNFEIGPTIGKGTFGKVKLGIHKITNEKVAVKIMDKEKLVDPGDKKRLQREISILRKIRHPNIIQLYEIIETTHQLYLFMEYAPNGELFNYIVKRTRLQERQASKFLQQIINGIEYISKIGVVHRDLKPENLLLDHNQNIKIVDFGLSNTYKDKNDKLTTACGSPCYAAPEMVAGKPYHGIHTDIWSAGVILYAMLCGYLPFEDSNTSELYKKIINQDPPLPNFLSKNAKGLLMGILAKDPNKRFTIQDIRMHPFCKEKEPALEGIVVGLNEIPIEEVILKQLENYQINLDTAVEMIKNNKHNSITSTYSLLLLKYIREGGKSIADLQLLRKTKSDNFPTSPSLNNNEALPTQFGFVKQNYMTESAAPNSKIENQDIKEEYKNGISLKIKQIKDQRESTQQSVPSESWNDKMASKFKSISPIKNQQKEEIYKKTQEQFSMIENQRQTNGLDFSSAVENQKIHLTKIEVNRVVQGVGGQRRILIDKISKISNYAVPQSQINKQNNISNSSNTNQLFASQQQKIVPVNYSSLATEDTRYIHKYKSQSMHQNQIQKYLTNAGEETSNGKIQATEQYSPQNKRNSQLSVLLQKNFIPNVNGAYSVGQTKKNDMNSTSTSFQQRYFSVQRQQPKQNQPTPSIEDKRNFRMGSYSIHKQRSNNISQNPRNSNDISINLTNNNTSKRFSVNAIKNPLQENAGNTNNVSINQRIRQKILNPSFNDTSFLNVSGSNTNNKNNLNMRISKENNKSSASNSRKDILTYGKTEEVVASQALPHQKMASLEVESDNVVKKYTSYQIEKNRTRSFINCNPHLQTENIDTQQQSYQNQEEFSNSFRTKKQEGSKSDNLKSQKVALYSIDYGKNNQQIQIEGNILQGNGDKYSSQQYISSQQSVVGSTKSNSRIQNYKFRKVKQNMYEDLGDLNLISQNQNDSSQLKQVGFEGGEQN